MIRSRKDGSYLGSPRTRQQSPSSLQTTAAEAVAALRVNTPAARKRTLVIAVMLISSVVVSCKRPASRIVQSSCRKPSPTVPLQAGPMDRGAGGCSNAKAKLIEEGLPAGAASWRMRVGLLMRQRRVFQDVAFLRVAAVRVHSVFCDPVYETRQIVPPVSSAMSSAPSLATASAAGRPHTSARRSPEAQKPTTKFS